MCLYKIHVDNIHLLLKSLKSSIDVGVDQNWSLLQSAGTKRLKFSMHAVTVTKSISPHSFNHGKLFVPFHKSRD